MKHDLREISSHFNIYGDFIIAVPYGLGAGSVDAALNNYASLHFSSKHINWLHC